MPGPGDLHVYVEELLAAGAEALDTIPDIEGTSLLGAPDRQFVSPGLPVADCCEMLTTWVDPLGEGSRSRQTLTANFRINRPRINLMILRCVPSGRVANKTYIPPSADALTASAEQIHADGWAIWNHLFNLIAAELLFDGRCVDLLWDPALSQTPSGGCGGWRFGLFVGIPGYPEDLGT